jgi:sugar phosphate isomerase/epimerase
MTCPVNRREFLGQTTLALAGTALVPAASRLVAQEKKDGMTLCLSPGSIGVKADQLETIALAQKHGFTSVEPFAQFLAGLSNDALAELLSDMKAKGLVFGAAGLSVDFRGDDARFNQSLRDLPRLAAALQRAGVTRVGTWISPGHNSRTYLTNFNLHKIRLTETARVLKDHGLRLGLEYVGTPSSWRRSRFPFIHTMAEARELITAIGTGNAGLVLDSWHWWTAGDTEADLLALKAEDVVAVDLNDAPAGIPLDQQIDNQRELPAATGVIPIGTFLKALRQIECDAPVRAEPFNKKLNAMDNDEACAATIQALRKATAA